MGEPLWELEPPPARWPGGAGRVRRGLEADLAAMPDGGDLPAGPVEALRVIADQIDVLDAALSSPYGKVKPYERTPLAVLAGQFADIYERFVSAAAGGDEFAAALDEFRRAAQAGDAARHPPAD